MPYLLIALSGNSFQKCTIRFHHSLPNDRVEDGETDKLNSKGKEAVSAAAHAFKMSTGRSLKKLGSRQRMGNIMLQIILP